MKTGTKPATRKGSGGVVVEVAGKSESQPTESFNLCPLGLQFYSTTKLKQFDLFEFNLAIAGGRKKAGVPVTCTGAVVKCRREKNDPRYRVWIQFLDLPKATREKIRCVARDGKHLCSYCENF